MKKRKHKPERFFVQLFIDTMQSPAWCDMSPIARLLYIALKKRYNRKTQQAVFLSVRGAAEELNFCKNAITPRYRELEHYGFVRRVKPASFGKLRGKAAHYRLADEPYEGKPPSLDFTHWKGVSFDRSGSRNDPVAQSVPRNDPQWVAPRDISGSRRGTFKKGHPQKGRENGGLQKPKWVAP